MYANFFSPSFLFFFLIISTLDHLPISFCIDNEQYVACAGLFGCANIPHLGYPFWRDNRSEHCGHPGFRLDCQGDVPIISILSAPYRVLGIDTLSTLITVARQDLWNNTCPRFLYNTTLDYNIFRHPPNDQNLTLFYGCSTIQPQLLRPPNEFECTVNGTTSDSYFVTRGQLIPNPNLLTCSRNTFVPVNDTAAQTLSTPTSSESDLRATLASGFRLLWEANDTNCNECARSGGRCGYNSSLTSFACYCIDRPYPLVCNDTGIANGSSPSRKTRVVLPVTGGVLAGIGITWLICFCRQRRKRKAAAAAAQAAAQTENGDPPNASSQALITIPSTHVSRRIPSFTSSRSGSGKGSTCFGVKVFSYKELKEATDNFNDSKELGSGGYGIVYYGTLKDGQTVAVKRLYETNLTRGGQFLNEVEILTRLNHENLVKLYGCTSKKSREHLLVYEYIPNGTVADHVHGEKANSSLLSWPVRLKIAIETADALAYLHASDIIHRDVKTNNILLDHSFRVKVADFGLSKLFPNDATHISTGPKGTPGYLDPDYLKWFRLTEKSDIYSFGVVLIELVSSLQAVDPERPQDASLASLAITKIQNQKVNELVDKSLGFETNSSVQKTTTLVAELAFRCLQEMYLRPSMKEVVEELRAIKIELDAQKVGEKLDVPVDGCASLEGKCPSARSPDSVTAKWISVSTVYSSY